MTPHPFLCAFFQCFLSYPSVLIWFLFWSSIFLQVCRFILLLSLGYGRRDHFPLEEGNPHGLGRCVKALGAFPAPLSAEARSRLSCEQGLSHYQHFLLKDFSTQKQNEKQMQICMVICNSATWWFFFHWWDFQDVLGSAQLPLHQQEFSCSGKSSCSAAGGSWKLWIVSFPFLVIIPSLNLTQSCFLHLLASSLASGIIAPD